MPNDYKEKKKYLDNKSDSIEVLFIGGSDAQMAFDPKYIKRRSYNAANPAQSLDYTYELLKKYENNWSNLKYIVLPVSYLTLFFKLEANPTEAWRIKNYNLYYKINISKNPKYDTEILNGRLFEHILRLIDYYIKNNNPITNADNGWNISSTSMTPDSLYISGIDAVKRHTIPKDRQCFDEMNAALVSIIDFSKKHNCKLILCTTPLCESYRENVDQYQYNITFKRLVKVTKENDNCTYLNFIDDARFRVEDYYDGDHLNYKGAQKLTFMIDSIINIQY